MAVDRRQATHFIKELLKGGTPDWIRFPHHYKAMVQEWHKQAHEELLRECRDYRADDQDTLSNPAGRRVNIMPAATFMRKLRTAGLTCFSHDSSLQDGSASLFVLMPSLEGGCFEPICSIQVPLMWEWSLLRIDPRTNLPTGFRDIGWRSAVACMIKKGVFTEERAHQIFRAPRVSIISRRYRRMLYEYRNGLLGEQNAA
jgi:hypothetical protein